MILDPTTVIRTREASEMKHYSLVQRLRVFEYMEANGCGAYTAAKVFGCSESAIHRWKWTKSRWWERARIQATYRVIDGTESNDPNERSRPVEVTTAIQLRGIITRNLDYLAEDEDLGSERHLRCSRLVQNLAREFPTLLSTTQTDLTALIQGEAPDEETSAADEWLGVQLQILAGGVTGEAK